MEMRRYLAVLERQDDFDQAGDAGCRFEMSDVALDRTHHQRRCLRAPVAERGHESPAPRWDLPTRCPCHAPRRSRYLPRRAARSRRACPDHLLPARRDAGDRESAAGTIVVDCRSARPVPARDRQRPGISDPLQHNNAAAFAAAEPVRVRGEALDAVRRKRSCHRTAQSRLPERESGARRQRVPHRTRRAQTLAGQMHGDKRRRAGGIDGQTWPAQAKKI